MWPVLNENKKIENGGGVEGWGGATATPPDVGVRRGGLQSSCLITLKDVEGSMLAVN